MLRKLALASCLALFCGCPGLVDTSTAEGVLVRAGTSFGMCIGYCNTELQITPNEVLFIETSRDPGLYPERRRRMTFETTEWDEIAALAQPSHFEGLQETYGCPDCADGGAEWIEIDANGTRRRVTFEHGDTIAPIQPLIEKTRRIRERFRQ